MDKIALKNWIEGFVNTDGKLSPWIGRPEWLAKKGNTKQHQAILDATAFMPVDTKLIERIVIIRQDITSRPLCKTCYNPVNYFAKYGGFAEYCSVKCSSTSIETKDKVKATNRIKFGADYNFQTPEFQQAATKTIQAKYGVVNVMQDSGIQEKQRQTVLKKYGVENIFQFEETKTQIAKKTKETAQTKYGLDHHILAKMPPGTYQHLTDPSWLFEQHHTLQKPLYVIARELGVTASIMPKYLSQAKIEQRFDWSTSMADREIGDYIISLGAEINLCNRGILEKKSEIDVWVPSKNLGIEHHGLYWHSFDFKETSEQVYYHQRKTRSAQKAGIQLLQIFGNEWEDPVTKDIWKSIIANRFGKNAKIFARQCEIVSVSSSNKTEFLEANHLQGNSQSSVNLGLLHNKELISLMTFSKSRFNKQFDYEMTRFVTAKYKTVVGGASRLFHTFTKQYPGASVISYVDLRFSGGDLYKTLKFEYLRTTHPNYYYYLPNENILYSRLAFQKHKLAKKLTTFDSNKTESENLFANGYRRIWDAGNMAFGFPAKV